MRLGRDAVLRTYYNIHTISFQIEQSAPTRSYYIIIMATDKENSTLILSSFS